MLLPSRGDELVEQPAGDGIVADWSLGQLQRRNQKATESSLVAGDQRCNLMDPSNEDPRQDIVFEPCGGNPGDDHVRRQSFEYPIHHGPAGQLCESSGAAQPRECRNPFAAAEECLVPRLQLDRRELVESGSEGVDGLGEQESLTARLDEIVIVGVKSPQYPQAGFADLRR